MVAKKKAAKKRSKRVIIKDANPLAGQKKRDGLYVLLQRYGCTPAEIQRVKVAIDDCKRGRPKAEVDRRAVELLASFGNSVADMSILLGVSKDTIERNCREELENGRGLMRANLRALQFRHAKSSYAMAIFLGKQYLGQSDVLRTDKFTDEELLARLRDAGIDIGAAIAAASAAEDQADDGPVTVH